MPSGYANADLAVRDYRLVPLRVIRDGTFNFRHPINEVRLHIHSFIARHLNPALGGLLVPIGIIALAPPIAARAQDAQTNDAAVVDHAVNIIGLDGVKPNGMVRLTIGPSDLVIATGTATNTIPFSTIRAFAVEHATRPLLRGTAGALAGFAPQGAGQLFGGFRLGAEILTVFYVDQNQGLHGAVVVLPTKIKAEALQAFTGTGIIAGNMPVIATSPKTPSSVGPLSPVEAAPAKKFAERPSVRIAFPVAGGAELPMAQIAGLYEELVAQTTKGQMFERVWREGDIRAGNDALTLSTVITKFQKGNAGVRGAIPIVGMLVGKTVIVANMRLTDASNAILLEKTLKGSKRSAGESIVATKSLAQRVNKSIKRLPEFKDRIPITRNASIDQL